MYFFMYVLFLFFYFSVNCGLILKNIFLFESVFFLGGSIITKLEESDEGIPWKSREVLKLDIHLHYILLNSLKPNEIY